MQPPRSTTPRSRATTPRGQQRVVHHMKARPDDFQLPQTHKTRFALSNRKPLYEPTPPQFMYHPPGSSRDGDERKQSVMTQHDEVPSTNSPRRPQSARARVGERRHTPKAPTAHELKNNPPSLKRYMRQFFIPAQRIKRGLATSSQPKQPSRTSSEVPVVASLADRLQRRTLVADGSKALNFAIQCSSQDKPVHEEVVDSAMNEISRRIESVRDSRAVAAPTSHKALPGGIPVPPTASAVPRGLAAMYSAGCEPTAVSAAAAGTEETGQTLRATAPSFPARHRPLHDDEEPAPEDPREGSIAHHLPSASTPAFRHELRRTLKECRTNPKKLLALNRYVQKNFVFKHYVPKASAGPQQSEGAAPPTGHSFQRTAEAGGGAAFHANTGTPQQQQLGQYLVQPTSTAPIAPHQPSPRRPQSARPLSAIDRKIEIVSTRKRALELEQLKVAENLEKEWLAKVEGDRRTDPSAPGEYLWRRDRLKAMIFAFVIFPQQILSNKQTAFDELKESKREDIVLKFATKMMAVVYRRRRRRIRIARKFMQAVVMWHWLKRKVAYRRYCVRLIQSALTLMARRKPTLFYLRRFYNKALCCQKYVRSRIAGATARMVWFLVKFFQHEMKVKGSSQGGDPTRFYPNIHALGGKSSEQIAQLCAVAAAKATGVPLEIKLAVFSSYWKQQSTRYLEKLRQYQAQQNFIRRLFLEGMSYPMACQGVYEADGVQLLRPHWPVIPSEGAIKTAFAAAQKRYIKQLREKFLARRKNHTFLTMQRFIMEVYHPGISYDAKNDVEKERHLLERKESDWLHLLVAPRKDRGRGTSSLPARGSAPEDREGSPLNASGASSYTSSTGWGRTEGTAGDMILAARLYAASFPPTASQQKFINKLLQEREQLKQMPPSAAVTRNNSSVALVPERHSSGSSLREGEERGQPQSKPPTPMNGSSRADQQPPAPSLR